MSKKLTSLHLFWEGTYLWVQSAKHRFKKKSKGIFELENGHRIPMWILSTWMERSVATMPNKYRCRCSLVLHLCLEKYYFIHVSFYANSRHRNRIQPIVSHFLEMTKNLKDILFDHFIDPKIDNFPQDIFLYY